MLKLKILVPLTTFGLCALNMQASAQLLGTASTFALLGGAGVTNTGLSVIYGDAGSGVTNSITGFATGVVNGSIHDNDAVALQALADASAAYLFLAGQPLQQDLSGQDLGGMTLTPGVYHFAAAAFLTGTLTLDAEGNSNAEFDIQMGSTLITGPNSAVKVINAGPGDGNIYWQVGSSATLGTGTQFAGHILAAASITMTTGASIANGSAFARLGSVTLDSNSIGIPAATPEPTSMLAMGAGLFGLFLKRRRCS